LVRHRIRRKSPPAKEGGVVNGKVQDYRFEDEKRKNIPDAGLASYYKEKRERRKYEYDPHLDPQLVWAGKVEHENFEVDTVALHIHERISSKAILKTVEKRELFKQLRLFGEPDLPLDKRIEFYQHEMDWTNRLILGDSLLVMNSLLEREMMAGKIQMIYIDPPYGIAYNSNFQPTIASVNVQAGSDESLTREPEQIKAYRDTWELGIHSYLTYLRDRLLLCRELLTTSGSVFVQISDENVHHVREVLDEVFGAENFVSLIPFRKKLMPLGAKTLENMCDYLLWYAKDMELLKYRQLYHKSEPKATSRWTGVELADGTRRKLTREETNNLSSLPKGSRVYRLVSQTAPSFSQSSVYEFTYKGRRFVPKPGLCWVTTKDRMEELARKNRLEIEGDSLSYVMYHDDFPFSKITNPWMDTIGAYNKVYVVQTNDVVIQRCVLMTTDVGDLVFDPTCGSGTTAYVCEHFGRRWITCDTSRVALAMARQRMLCAVFLYYKLADPAKGVSGGFSYESVSHITLRSLAQNEPPETETLHDKPIVEHDKIRVSGPFTVEAIPVPSIEDPSLLSMSPRESITEELPPTVAKDHVSRMLVLVEKNGITFPRGKQITLENVRPVLSAGFLHAEAQARRNGDVSRVALSFGPRYGPVTAKQVEEGIRSAYMMGFNEVVFAGFTFDPEALATIQKNPHPNLQVHMANVCPDVEMGDLLKSAKGSQLFTVFGQPDVGIKRFGEEYVVELLGVDIYDPTKGEVHPSRPEDVAAWFLDQNYNGYTFCITQAFFPKEATNRNPWDKLENALHGSISKEKMEKLRGTSSLPFKAGDQKRIAVKVIDQRGNEVIVVKKLEEAAQG
jgi:adenine-specific DNA-methyltransferase